LWHDDRHRQLLDVAERLLSERGWDGLSLTELAPAAGVTRPIVYKHWKSRRELILELVRRYADELQAMLLGAARRHPDRLDLCLRLALDGLCDAIEARGPGAWNLLSTGGPEPALNRAIESLRGELMRPWVPRVRKLTGVPPRHALVLCHLTFALVRAVLERWTDGELGRDEVEWLLGRSLAAQLSAFGDYRAGARSWSSAAASRTRPSASSSVSQPIPMRKRSGISKNRPGTTLVS
jgi:AcrR family transcriptional regulator